MAGQVVDRPAPSFEFELVEGDSDELTTVVASASDIIRWIEPTAIKLRQKIGKGLFGDVWLATHYQVGKDYEEYHDVAVKMLHPIKEDNVNAVLDKLNDLFSNSQGSEGACCLNGISIISGKICIIMKFYEESVGDRMAHLKGGKLPLHDVLRYGIDLAQGIMNLHSKGILLLNLKPSNFLIDRDNRAILGDLGVPYLLLGVPFPSSDMTRRLGTPNNMAPEQWQPEIRGPMSFETDSWGFACSIVEMVTGIQPWSGKSIDEIKKSVVKRQEIPQIPDGLPPAVENVIFGCFEYDFRNRPLMEDILLAFKSSQNAVFRDGSWTDTVSRSITEKQSPNGYTEWFLSKECLQVGDMVRSRKPINSCKPKNMDVPEGTIVGLERESDQNGFALVRVHGIHDPIRVHVSSLERVTFGLAAWDWVRLKKQENNQSPVGILHSVNRDGIVSVGFIGSETLWKGTYTDIQMSESYCVGQFVRLKSTIFSPRFDWPRKDGCGWATGRVDQIFPNGCLAVKFPGKLTFDDESSIFLADPAEVEPVSFKTSSGVVKKYQHLEDFHWAVRPILIALGLFTAMKLGFLVGKKMGKSKLKKNGKSTVMPHDGQHKQADGQSGGWLGPKVANIFRDAGTTTMSR